MITLIAISMVVFSILALAPGDPYAEFAANPNVPPAVRARLKEQLGTEDPIHLRYIKWSTQYLQGNWGQSFTFKTSVRDYILHRIPVVNSIYSSVKQISDTLFSSSGQAFRKALLVQWPREGTWTIAFLTGTPSGTVASHIPPDCVSVYVPTTPNPTGGYFVIVPRKDVVELDMTVDQALKYIISMGVVPPPDAKP